jgi:hypothetical protein
MKAIIPVDIQGRGLWHTEVEKTTTIYDLLMMLSQILRIPVDHLSLWDCDRLLLPLSKPHLLVVDKSTGIAPVLRLYISQEPRPQLPPLICAMPSPSPSAAPPPAAPPSAVDLSSIDPREQEAIYRQIREDRIRENLSQAPSPSIGVKIRAIICKVHGKTLRMIVDTGASISVLYMNHVELCSVGYLINDHELCRPVLTGIADATSRAVGVIHALEVDVGGVSTRGTFVVLAGAQINGIIGIDWMTQNRAMIDVAGDAMQLPGLRVPFVDP